MVDFLDHDFLQDQLANINQGLQKDMDKLTEANDTIKRLNKDIERLTEENLNYETINEAHKALNGDLRKQIAKLELEKKQLEIKTQKHFEEFRNKGDL